MHLRSHGSILVYAVDRDGGDRHEQAATLIAASRGQSRSFWDAMLWATAREAGVTVILTEDFQKGRELGGVRFRNPFAVAPRVG